MTEIENFRGVYGVWREDTGGGLRQELLVLEHDGKGSGRTYATMISPDVVVRGRFAPMGGTIWCQMSGFRDKSQPDVRVLAIAVEEIPESRRAGLHAMAGVGVGLATADQRAPAVMPVWAIRIGLAHSDQLRLDRADRILRDEFQAALKRNVSQLPTFETLKNVALNDPVIRPQLAKEAKRIIESENNRTLVLPGILDFCGLPVPQSGAPVPSATGRVTRRRAGPRTTRK